MLGVRRGGGSRRQSPWVCWWRVPRRGARGAAASWSDAFGGAAHCDPTDEFGECERDGGGLGGFDRRPGLDASEFDAACGPSVGASCCAHDVHAELGGVSSAAERGLYRRLCDVGRAESASDDCGFAVRPLNGARLLALVARRRRRCLEDGGSRCAGLVLQVRYGALDRGADRADPFVVLAVLTAELSADCEDSASRSIHVVAE